MTRYLGVRFERRYREPGTEPFRFDHPTVDVGRQRVWRMTDVAERLDVETDRLLELVRVEDAPYVHEHVKHDYADPFRLQPHEAAELRAICDDLAEAIADAVDVEAVGAETLAASGDVREAVGAFRHDCLAVHERAEDVIEVCDAGLDLGVHLEVY